jgi:hypothetical protein
MRVQGVLRTRSSRISLWSRGDRVLCIAIGWNEASHYAQVRAFDHGTPIIDRYRHTTGDRAVFRGHYYSDKAPGLALLALPVYHVLRAGGISRPRPTVHVLVLFGSVLPAAVIMSLAYWLVQRRDPGEGAAVALTLGFATLILPFATLFFSHVLSACLRFAAYCLLWREREGREDGGSGGRRVDAVDAADADGATGAAGGPGRRYGLLAAAGLLIGYGISTEYPLALVAVVLGLYAMWGPNPLQAAIAFGAGALVGLIPLLLYDWWAFGSPLHLSYSYVAANSSGVLGLGGPSLHRAMELLVADRGLLVVTPVVAAGLAGIVILYREGRRQDALIPAAVAVAYFAYSVLRARPIACWATGKATGTGLTHIRRWASTVKPAAAIAAGVSRAVWQPPNACGQKSRSTAF